MKNEILKIQEDIKTIQDVTREIKELLANWDGK